MYIMIRYNTSDQVRKIQAPLNDCKHLITAFLLTISSFVYHSNSLTCVLNASKTASCLTIKRELTHFCTYVFRFQANENSFCFCIPNYGYIHLYLNDLLAVLSLFNK